MSMKDQFRRILDLVRKTGDTMVVTDPDGEESFVVMDIEQYEMLLNIGEWPDGEQEGESAEIDQIGKKDPDIWQTMKPAGAEGETWDLGRMDEKELADLEDQYRQFAQRNVKEAMKPIEEPKKPDSDDFGEEQFYLEPVE